MRDPRICAPSDEDFAQRPAGAGVPMVPVGPSARTLTTGVPPSSSDLPRRAAESIAGQFDPVTEAAEGCDALVATGMMPAAAGARSVAEKPGIRSVSVTFRQLTPPSPHHPPPAYPGPPFPPEVTDNRVLWDLDAPRRSGSTHRVPVGRAQDGPDPRDPRPNDRRGRHDPHRRGGGGREAAARRGRPGVADNRRSEPMT
ncbi:hypothetical protein [Sphaerisporangium album]|uniref:hypothetical protein n=1 Tax=Sphaerisporangium album TaxID=509200 RepID=UPI001C692EAA|nr:hypothetical protein [Sphaerisporangium album]